jgi:ABC-type antimicrobial peptide transport system permease subunit
MFYITYMFAELRRRLGRTVLTALGLGIGVGLVVTVTALSNGLDRAQAQVLEPLTGVGTDMSVSRPIEFSDSGNGPFQQLSDEEREQLRSENGGGRFGLQNLGEPGEKFSRDTFVANISKIDGVESAAGGLTLNSLHIEGTVPEQQQQQQPGQFGGPGAGGGPPNNINATSLSVSGVDQTQEELGAITPGQIVKGSYFGSGDARQAILNESYASSEGLSVGDTVKLGGKNVTVIGIAETPLGGQSSDVYVKLSQLQDLADRKGRVNTVYVRAESSDDVAAVSTEIESTVDGASVTTAADLASKLGAALAIVGLLAAFLIASLLTLSSVTKRTREFGTLKALGWSQWLVVRQVTFESLFQGLLGGAIGVCLGLMGAAAIAAFSPSLNATVSGAAEQAGGFFGGGGGGGPGPFGQGNVEEQATEVALGAPISVTLVLAAVGLAVLGGLIAGAVGSLRASRLRPADALRHID